MENNDKQTCPSDENPGWRFWKRRRNVVATMAFLGFFNIYVLRANLSIAIVAMTENRSITLENGTEVFEQDFDWNSKVQGFVLSSFFYGYATTQLLGGWLANRFGGNILFGIGIATTALMTLITPFVARIDVNLLIALRIFEGVFEGVTYPSMHAVWSKWAPPLERSRLASFAYNGAYIGTVVAMPGCAYLSEWLGWPSIFYVSGTSGLLWFLFWIMIVSESPASDPSISKAELKYIQMSLGSNEEKVLKHPWGSILTSVPFWATVTANFSENWGFYTFLTQLPKYMKDALNFDLGEAGMMAALPYVAMSIMLPISGALADMLITRKLLTVGQVRKLFNCGAFLSQTVFVIGTAYSTSATLALIFLILAEGFGSFSLAGFTINYMDLAPQHASILLGIGNTVGSIPGILSPIVSGYIVTTSTRDEWQIIFFITAGIYLFGCIIFGVFAKGEMQPWATETEVLNTRPKSKSKELKGVENPAFQDHI